jgi:hypothetical protein
MQQTGGEPIDPSLTLTRTQFPAIVGNAGNRKPVVYAMTTDIVS